jgi:isopentenyldiphosphate isomerase
MNEQVILVNSDDQQIGITSKLDIHRRATLYHAFSIFISTSRSDILLRQRANKFAVCLHSWDKINLVFSIWIQKFNKLYNRDVCLAD